MQARRTTRLRLLFVLCVKEDEYEYEELINLSLLLLVLGVKEDECKHEGLLRLRLLFVLCVEEDEGEDKDAGHHREGAGVVGVGGGDEALVLVVHQRVNRHLVIQLLN